MTAAYPLAWPEGWPRTAPNERLDSKYTFRRPNDHPAAVGKTKFWTFGNARTALLHELDRLGAASAVISSNYQLRLADGLPRADRGTPSDTGVAIYFELHGRPMVMASDRHLRAEENMRSITLAIEAMRQLARHGGGAMMERAFTGFAALPPPSAGRPWHEVLELPPGESSQASIQAAYRHLAMRCHPDRGGSAEAFAELQRARDEALAASTGQS